MEYKITWLDGNGTLMLENIVHHETADGLIFFYRNTKPVSDEYVVAAIINGRAIKSIEVKWTSQ